MATRTDQLLCIAKATGSKIYTMESEAEAQGMVKALVLSLKQFHAHYYRHYKKGQPGLWWVSKAYTQVMSSGILICQQVWAWSHSALGDFIFGQNTETTATHPREVHYRLAIVCSVC